MENKIVETKQDLYLIMVDKLQKGYEVGMVILSDKVEPVDMVIYASEQPTDRLMKNCVQALQMLCKKHGLAVDIMIEGVIMPDF